MTDVIVIPKSEAKRLILSIKDSYSTEVRHFVEFLEAGGLELNLEGLQAYQRSMKRVPYGTACKRISAAKHRIRWLFDKSPESLDLTKKFRFDQAMKGVKMKKKVSSAIAERRILSAEEIQKLIASTGRAPRTSLMIEFLAFTGVRVSEAIGIRRTDVKETESNCAIRIHGKGDKEREVLIEKSLYWRIRDTFAGRMWFFETKGGRPYSRDNVSKEIGRMALKVLGKKVSAHTFRHSFATIKLRATNNLKGVSKYLGHSSVKTTADFYLHDDLTWNDLLKV